jgi:hypothetical protein
MVAFYTAFMLRRIQNLRAAFLVVLMVWFATHHVAPTFGMTTHGQLHEQVLEHQARQDQTLQWTAPHTHVQHCEFCSAAGYLGIWVANVLPRAPEQLTRAVVVMALVLNRLGNSAQARAPPVLQ